MITKGESFIEISGEDQTVTLATASIVAVHVNWGTNNVTVFYAGGQYIPLHDKDSQRLAKVYNDIKAAAFGS